MKPMSWMIGMRLFRLRDVDGNAFIFFIQVVEFFYSVKQDIDVCQAFGLNEYAALGVLRLGAEVDADAFAFGDVLDDGKEFFEPRRPCAVKRVRAGGDDEVRVFKGRVRERCLEGQVNDARHRFALWLVSLEFDCCHDGGICVCRYNQFRTMLRRR